jgi:hypothetical protein
MRSRSFEISGNLLKSNRIFQTAAFMLRCDPLSVSGHSQGLESAFMTLLDATIDAFTGTTKGLAHEIGRGVSGSRRACRGWPNTRSVPHPISWTVFLIIIMQQPQGQAASDEPAAGIGS